MSILSAARITRIEFKRPTRKVERKFSQRESRGVRKDERAKADFEMETEAPGRLRIERGNCHHSAQR